MKRRTILIFFTISVSLVVWGQVPPGLNCEANFTYQQDPSNYLIVNFVSTSTGDITDYWWDFGDGSSSGGENPSHAFPFEGEFTVCLTVSNSGINPCLDSICKTVVVHPIISYDLGGLLFAGIFPINNPVSTGDTGFAYLYRFEPAGLIPVDTVMFDTLGYFWFSGLEEGKYFLKAGLKETSLRFAQYLPSYHVDDLFWFDSDTIFLDYDIYNAGIYMIPGMPISPGEGHIHGTLLIEQSTGSPIPLKQGQVVLADVDGDPYLCDYTDDSGEFLFDKIPPGEYQIFGEYPGSYSQRLDVILDSNNNSIDNLFLVIYSEIPGIHIDEGSAPVSVQIFPNPTDRLLNIQLTVEYPKQITVQFYNYTGQAVLTSVLQMPAGQFHEVLNVEALPPGIYLISFRGKNENWHVVKKLLKN